MCNKECLRFEQQLAFHTAPSLLGIKCASLMSATKCGFDIGAYSEIFNRRAAARGLKIKTMCECDNRVLLLLYNENKLSARLGDPECRRLLAENGYSDDMSTEQCLDRLAKRISEQNGFPHEVGVFLDYPIEDVIGFIRNNGSCYKLSGYWKVYGDPDRAQRTFDNYNKCRKFLCNKLSEGEDLCCALKIS